MWIDRYQYKMIDPEWPKDATVTSFCPEGYYKPGDIIDFSSRKAEVVSVEPRIKEANEYVERLWAGKEDVVNERFPKVFD